MTVEELIEELKKCNPKAIVIRADYVPASDSWEDLEIGDVFELCGKLYQKARFTTEHTNKVGKGDIVSLI